jgi:hypothetical protein
MQKGDLVYVPSGTIMYKLDGKTPTQWENLDEPASFIICGEVDSFYKVFHRGAAWHLLRRETTLLQRVKDDYQVSRNFRK